VINDGEIISSSAIAGGDTGYRSKINVVYAFCMVIGNELIFFNKACRSNEGFAL